MLYDMLLFFTYVHDQWDNPEHEELLKRLWKVNFLLSPQYQSGLFLAAICYLNTNCSIVFCGIAMYVIMVCLVFYW